MRQSKEEGRTQAFFDIIFSFYWKGKIDIKEEKEKAQLIITEWIKEGEKKYKETDYEKIREEYSSHYKKWRMNKGLLEREFSWLWLSYSPRATIIKKKLCEQCGKKEAEKDASWCKECLIELNEL